MLGFCLLAFSPLFPAEKRATRSGIEDDRGGAERSPGQEGSCQVQRGRHDWGFEEAGGGADWDAAGKNSHPEVV